MPASRLVEAHAESEIICGALDSTALQPYRLDFLDAYLRRTLPVLDGLTAHELIDRVFGL